VISQLQQIVIAVINNGLADFEHGFILSAPSRAFHGTKVCGVLTFWP
jgi:hypothetical protein